MTTTFKVTGRHVFNVWRIMRSEQTLGSYTFENVAFYLLRKRVPRHTPATLTRWYNSESPVHTARVLGYFRDRTVMTLDILEESETTTKTAEFARVFGVDFHSVISRGSQFKVESFLFRIAKPESFVLLSPSKQDVGKQNAAECMPLIMEPLSAFYNGPLVVLDFQYLYPSVMIAYNYCYSTCLGRVADFQGRNKLGSTDLDLPPGLLEKLQDHITIAPNGIIYVKPSVRQGLLGRMLTERDGEAGDEERQERQGALTRGSSFPYSRCLSAMSRILDARQLGLEYIASVMYGYTSATYSGRMPAVEIADSIVQTGRETLERVGVWWTCVFEERRPIPCEIQAISVIDTTAKWGARVVYGDTDSVFIHLKGKTKEQAFKIGYDIADAITAMNPAPIKLKFEKVYLLCVLMAKKRYVGFKYETPDETEPTFDAVRRDGVPAQTKMTETCLKILFCTQDLSENFIFAKEVRMGTYRRGIACIAMPGKVQAIRLISDKVPLPPGVAVAARRILQDENDEPQYGERVPYVIVCGDSHTRLVERAIYNVNHQTIAHRRVLLHYQGADTPAGAHLANRFKIYEHFQSARCLTCSCTAQDGKLDLVCWIDTDVLLGICEACHANLQVTIPTLLLRLRKGEQMLLSASSEPIACMNIECPWLYERTKAEQKLDFLEGLRTLIEDLDVS
ncbi:hypothetical protein JVT61DRAFT_1552 [Boletus reticuloceps]|uniref:DNA polymerase n=1 Tax=Boletus reticuloceps TaxID=495285 RepID=A0A8I2YQY3_9AGAM|nr:hypothetical protein JVT61DRAFT_1552 [Boletus reticuloceps]